MKNGNAVDLCLASHSGSACGSGSNTSVSTTTSTTSSSSTGTAVSGSDSGSASGERTLTDRHLWVRPYGSHASQDGSNGTSGFSANTFALDLNVAGASTQSLVFRLGAALDHAVTEHVNISLNLSGGYDALAGQNLISSSLAEGGPAFTTYGTRTSHWLVDSGIGVSGTLHNGMQLSLDYSVEARERYVQQSLAARMRLPF